MPYATQQMVIDFHKQCKLSIGDPTKPDITVDQDLRLELIREELVELVEALEAGDIIKTADALGDLQYVINGAAVSWGIDLGPIFEEIHRSNMTKKPENMRSDGKILKDADYSPPDLKRVMHESAREFKQAWIEGDDVGWPRYQEEPSLEVSRKIMDAAKDFVSKHHLPGELASKILKTQGAADFIDEEPTNPNTKIKGQLTPYGAFIFSCECGRTHAISFKLGSRGGMAESGTAECICGKAFVAKFNNGEPTLEVTTIEELRKAHA